MYAKFLLLLNNSIILFMFQPQINPETNQRIYR